MCKINSLLERDKQTISRLIGIWESSVKGTHTFLSDSDITQIKLEVSQGLKTIELLYGYFDNDGILQGFIGISNQKIEMFFIHNNARLQGIGKQLLNYAVDNLGAKFVDVNEQNEQGVGFYRYMGFHVISRSEYDEQGRPFPLLHLGLNQSQV
jgi:putative acetyltransferase